MNHLSVQAISPATLSALSVLKPVSALGGQTSPAVATPLSVQDLGQNLFRQSLQAAAQSVVDPSAGTSLVQEVTSSLLASLTAPQATANTTVMADATTNPAAIQTTSTATNAATASNTNTSATASAMALADVSAAQDAFAASSSADFALQTAARFGAGVVGQATATPEVADLSAGLIRDAAAVQRLGNLQPHAGGPGPGTFAQPQATSRLLRSYEAAPIAQSAGSAGKIDLLV
jgi:hypothetical protein